METVKMIVSVLGWLGEVAWIIMMLLAWFGSDRLHEWFKRHKIVSGAIMILVLIGWIYFMVGIARREMGI